MDGQGNYDGIQMKPGDTIQLKTVKDVSVPVEALRFLGKDDWYQEKELKVAALTSRPLAKWILSSVMTQIVTEWILL